MAMTMTMAMTITNNLCSYFSSTSTTRFTTIGFIVAHVIMNMKSFQNSDAAAAI